MRGSPTRALPASRCPACAFPRTHCLCAEVPRIELPVRFVVLRHASEIPRLTSSARWAALALPGTEVLDYALPGTRLDGSRLDRPDSWVLFPSARPTPPGSARPSTLVVPDGTWAQARRMVQRVPALRAMPRLSLAPAAPAPRLRRPHLAGGMSTLEAMASAVALLGHAEAAEALRRLNALAVERASSLRGFPAAVS